MPNNNKNIQPLSSANIQLQHFAYQQFGVIASKGVTKSDILTPKYWQFVAPKLQHFDELRIIAEDGSFYMRVLVTFVQGTNVKVKELEYKKLEAHTEEDYNDNSEYEVYHKGGNRGFAVRKKDTGEIIIENCASRSDAHKQLEEFERAMRA